MPGLIRFGEQAVSRILEDDALRDRFDDPDRYHFGIVCAAIGCGVLSGRKRRLRSGEPDGPGCVDPALREGFRALPEDIIRSDLGMDGRRFFACCREIFARWCARLEPCLKRKDASVYTHCATLAAFQAGAISY